MFLLNRELISDLLTVLQAFQYQLIFVLHYSCVVLMSDVYGNLSYNLLSTVFCFHIFDDGKVIMHM